MNLDLSIVVPCLNRHMSTRRLLASLARSADRFQVVIVDDASPESLESVVREFDGRLDVEYLRLPRRSGPAAARNQGIARARGRFIAFTDNDCVAHPSWPRELSIYLRDAPPRVVGVGGRVLALGDDIYSRYFTYHKILDPFLSGGRYLYLVTANAAFRRTALEEVGGFDEAVRQPGGEDPGLSFKLLGRGYMLHYRKEALVYHDYRGGLRDFARTFFRYGRGCRTEIEKYAGTLTQEARPFVGGFGGVTDLSGEDIASQ